MSVLLLFVGTLKQIYEYLQRSPHTMRHDSSMAIEGNLSVHREIWNARTSEKRAVYVTIIMFQSGKGCPTRVLLWNT